MDKLKVPITLAWLEVHGLLSRAIRLTDGTLESVNESGVTLIDVSQPEPFWTLTVLK